MLIIFFVPTANAPDESSGYALTGWKEEWKKEKNNPKWPS